MDVLMVGGWVVWLVGHLVASLAKKMAVELAVSLVERTAG